MQLGLTAFYMLFPGGPELVGNWTIPRVTTLNLGMHGVAYATVAPRRCDRDAHIVFSSPFALVAWTTWFTTEVLSRA